MKKTVCLLLVLALLLPLAACAGTVPSGEACDVDLTRLGSNMVYAEVFNMMNTPEEYLGKSIRMEGTFSVYEDEEHDRNYYACVIEDATACCAQGIEFVLREARHYPDEYPEVGAHIVVTGVYDVYEEDGWNYCQLVDAELEAS